MKYTGPKLRKARALGEDFAMSADRSMAAKFVKAIRKQPPGVHGKRRGFAKITGYGLQLKEKQKARVFYLLTEHQLRRYYTAASTKTGSTNVAFLVGMETRLDNVVYRAGFTDSHSAARQLVGHAHFALNGKKVNIPSMQVRPGDVITFRATSSKLSDFVKDKASSNKPAPWISTEPTKLEIKVNSLPTRSEIEVPFNEQQIIEFYSR